jgi:acetolactate synthase-1/2/3 large subunit
MLEKCLNTPGVHVIDVPVDYSENQKVLIDELQALTCIL